MNFSLKTMNVALNSAGVAELPDVIRCRHGYVPTPANLLVYGRATKRATISGSILIYVMY